ncbi:MAG: hypothetical protein ACTSU2_08425 [Promethearchaeota archaeon]
MTDNNERKEGKIAADEDKDKDKDSLKKEEHNEHDEFLPISNILKSIKKKYDEDDDKNAWQVHGGRDKYGNYDMIFSRDPDVWMLKSKPIDPFRNISFGRKLYVKSLDDEINAEIKKSSKDPNEIFHTLFGMSAIASEREIISAFGVQNTDPNRVNMIKNKIDEKYKGLELKLRKKVKKTWNQYYGDRDNVFL